MKNSNDTIGNRTHDLLTCSAVPQPHDSWLAVLFPELWSFELPAVVLNLLLQEMRVCGFRTHCRRLSLLSKTVFIEPEKAPTEDVWINMIRMIKLRIIFWWDMYKQEKHRDIEPISTDTYLLTDLLHGAESFLRS